jgi:biuret amidohydrolase
MPHFDIRPDRTAFLIIDMQNAFLQPGGPLERPAGREIVDRLNALGACCRRYAIKVVYTRQVFRRDGSDMGLFTAFVKAPPSGFALLEGSPDAGFYPALDHPGTDLDITKVAYSAFAGTELDIILRGKGIDTLILGGVDTAVCCESTARDARHCNYRVIFLSDGTATRDMPDRGWGRVSAGEVQKTVLTLMAFAFAEVATVADVIRRIETYAMKAEKES